LIKHESSLGKQHDYRGSASMDHLFRLARLIIQPKTRSPQPFPAILFNLVFLFLVLAPTKQARTIITYVFQSGTPAAIRNFLQPEAGCKWLGVGGQVFSQTGNPTTGLVVKLSGSLEGKQLLQFGVTGSSIKLGPGGFQFQLSDHPIASQGTVTIQLFDIAGVPQSGIFHLTTYNDCAKNLIIANLILARFDKFAFLPLVVR